MTFVPGRSNPGRALWVVTVAAALVFLVGCDASLPGVGDVLPPPRGEVALGEDGSGPDAPSAPDAGAFEDVPDDIASEDVACDLDTIERDDLAPSDTSPGDADGTGPSFWSAFDVPTGADLRAVACTQDSVWAVGEGGEILHSYDGAPFAAQASQTEVQLNSVAFVDGLEGIAVGGSTIVETSDGGSSWDRAAFCAIVPMSEYHHVIFRDPARRFVVGQSTGDAGTFKYHTGRFWNCDQTWPGYTLLTGADSGEALFMTGATGGVVLKRVHEGSDWQEVATGSETIFYDIHFRDELVGWLVGSEGALLVTVDGGVSWTALDSGVSTTLRGVASSKGGLVVVVGDEGTILESRDGGSTFVQVHDAPASGGLRGVCLRGTTAYAVGDGGVILHKSFDGGYCGDGVINGPEDCDGDDLGGATCSSLGYHEGGELGCTPGCEFDVSGCLGGYCGDGIVNGPEECDGDDLGGESCASLGYHEGGTLGCTPGCEFDVSGCLGGYCGDGVINGPEDCDGDDLGGATCADFGFYGGALLCTPDCEFDVSGCSGGYCGDGIANGPEDCDGDDLGGATCSSLGYHEGGELGCTPDCELDVSGCLGGYCGDGIKNGPEECDGDDLGGASCASLGYEEGTLACGADCTFDTSGCGSGWECGAKLVDSRDQREYGTARFGELCWMTDNLDVGEMILADEPQTVGETIAKYCYWNNESLCESHGGLYQWNQAMQGDSIEGAQGICPPGWHLPTDGEWQALEIHLGMSPATAVMNQWRGAPVGALMRVGGGSGVDALLGGAVNGFSSTFFNYPAYGYYWTSTMGPQGPWRRCFTDDDSYYDPETVGRWQTWPASYALSLRCVKPLP